MPNMVCIVVRCLAGFVGPLGWRLGRRVFQDLRIRLRLFGSKPQYGDELVLLHSNVRSLPALLCRNAILDTPGVRRAADDSAARVPGSLGRCLLSTWYVIQAGPNAARRIDWHCPTTAGATYLGEDGQRCAGMHLCDPRTGLSLPDGLLALAVNGVGQCQLHVLPVPCVQRVFGDMHAGLFVIVSKAGQGTAAYGEGTRKG